MNKCNFTEIIEELSYDNSDRYVNQKTKRYLISDFKTLDLFHDKKEKFNNIIPMDEFNNHMYVLGSTKSGKSEFLKLMFIGQALEQNVSIVIFDPHGDLARQCAKIMDDKKDIIYIDPTLKKGFTPTLNPFRIKKINEETISIVAQELINVFESIIGETFSTNIGVLITPLIYTLLRKGDSGIDELVRFLDDDNQDLIELGLKSPIKEHRNFFKKQFSKEKFNRSKEALSSKLQIFLNNPIFANFLTGDSTFDLEKALNNKRIIIFRFPKGQMRKTLEPISKLVMALIQGIVFQRSKLAEDLRPKTYMICDEYQNFFSHISNEILSESRKNNLFILGAHQHLSQLDTKSRDGILSAANIIVVGKNSRKDLKIMSEEIGINIESLENLKTGEFYIKIGSNDAIKIVTTDKYLGNKHSIPDELWEKHLKYQIKHYYKRIDVDLEDTTIKTKPDDFARNPSLPIPKFDEE